MSHPSKKSSARAAGLGPILAAALVAILAPGAATADVDVAAKVEQLRQNVDASRSNLAQYEENAKTVEINIRENEKALKALAKQREALNHQAIEIAAGSGGVESAKKQVDGYIKAEQEKLAAERKQKEALERALAQIEDNRKRREANVVAYQEKLRSIDADAGAWSQRSQAVADADRALKEKETIAAADKKRLAEKRVQYAAEVEKWQAQQRVSDRQYANFSKLRDE
jgi:chromosome segregation ATPase